MKIKLVSLEKLITNSSNDRHGELADPESAIEWLLKHRATHMRSLARDIVREGQVFEPPLVHLENGDYTVFDGNRRVTCLKLIAKPTLAPTEDWRDFFQGLRDEWDGTPPSSIQCQVEEDRDRIDEILYRRHTGSQSGIGQSQWNDEAKTNFIRRTGKKTRVNVAELIEKKLVEAELLAAGGKLPRSNLNRLLSAESYRNRVGISLVKNHLEFTHDKDVVLAGLQRICTDLINKIIVLDDIWDQKAKTKYLNTLEKESMLPTAEHALDVSEGFKKASVKKPAIAPPDQAPKPGQPDSMVNRMTLIRQIDYGLEPSSTNVRIIDVWNELQHRLKFGLHDNAISVLFRVLVELSIDHYITSVQMAAAHPNDKLKLKFQKVCDDLLSKGQIDKKYREGLKKFEANDALFSANTMNSYVHSKDFFPSDSHLKSMWDTFAMMLVKCVNAKS